MGKFELLLPKMGESVTDATIINWSKNVGDKVEVDETVLEVATDKVDSEVASPVDGVIVEILHPVDTVVEVGNVLAIIETDGVDSVSNEGETSKEIVNPAVSEKQNNDVPFVPASDEDSTTQKVTSTTDRFYSPLVKNIAKEENISQSELDSIQGTGANDRVTKNDVLGYIKNKSTAPSVSESKPTPQPEKSPVRKPIAISGDYEIVEMDRMRKMIAEHMVMSKQTSPHVQSLIEVDMTKIVNWRNKIKNNFVSKYGEKITFTPIIMQAVAKALVDFPMINVSVDGNSIIVKKDINIGMAAALPSGNLIVPVVKNADMLNLVGLTKKVNDLANRSRDNKLNPDEIQGGTFTLTNVGSFGNDIGVPIINQPQVAILAVGSIKKKPAVLETEHGDVIAVRQMMFITLSYDHRVVDGALGGKFTRRVADYLESFDDTQTI